MCPQCVPVAVSPLYQSVFSQCAPSSSRPPLSSGPAPLRLNRALSGAGTEQNGTWTVCACVKCLISLYILSVNEPTYCTVIITMLLFNHTIFVYGIIMLYQQYNIITILIIIIADGVHSS